ncbi:hypothetical protein RSOLAG1IB_00577 [Rhizoctonia solani AG-1 IB]|uniref:Uncharacterized protein n=1 Tax=Thanatephorus cucumeris (strain AG1-IB / isolate 7/3/14) TaxID=1108050 RepID=A0A0B7F3E0_THACB|nr:hypothetical protein RSOLAG1IB_00577 [Rhizoctonia solani AG-1 IB]
MSGTATQLHTKRCDVVAATESASSERDGLKSLIKRRQPPVDLAPHRWEKQFGTSDGLNFQAEWSKIHETSTTWVQS